MRFYHLFTALLAAIIPLSASADYDFEQSAPYADEARATETLGKAPLENGAWECHCVCSIVSKTASFAFTAEIGGKCVGAEEGLLCRGEDDETGTRFTGELSSCEDIFIQSK